MQLNATVIDSSIYHDIFSTTAMRAVWSDQGEFSAGLRKVRPDAVRLPCYVAASFAYWLFGDSWVKGYADAVAGDCSVDRGRAL
jgi:hypothetical protein